MVNVIHRTALEFRERVHTPAYPEPEWKHDPDMSAVSGVPRRYWKAPSDWSPDGAGPVEMTQSEKDAVDAAAQTEADDNCMAQFDTRDALAAFALLVLDEINTLRAEHGLSERTVAQLKAAIRNKLETL